MSKRELGLLSSVVDVEAPRAKRRKEMAPSTSDQDVTMSEPVEPAKEGETAQGGSIEEGTVKEQALKLWQTIKDAVNKEGRLLSFAFLRQPSKRQYPDYYILIPHPIAFEDIRKQIDNNAYSSLEAVKQDFDLCFKNAKNYNVKGSEIWNDAKELQKLTNKTYNKMTKVDDVHADGAHEDGDDDGKKNKTKTPNMNRLLKARLQKLVDKTHDSGRVLSTEFMELPNKKDWPSYYKEIKRPQCFENIFKHLKRKEYHTSAEFASDVELVFSNAMTFNQDHTDIWEDARVLRDYFHQLMSDLPEPYALAEYTKPSNGKIKLKMPAAAQPSASTSSPPRPPPAQPQSTPSAGLLLRVPGSANNNSIVKAPSQPVSTPVIPLPALPPISDPTPPPAPSQPLPHTLVHTTTVTPQVATQPLPYINATFAHYPNVPYAPPVNTVAVPAQAPPTPQPAVVSHPVSLSPPPPPIHPNHQLKFVTIVTEPRKRPLHLDYRDGVKNWAMRLVSGEKGVCVSDVTFLGDEDEDSSGDEEDDEEKDDEVGEADVPAKNGKKKGKGRGRPPKATTKAAAVAVKTKTVRLPKKKVTKPADIILKLNGSLVKEKEGTDGQWLVDLPVGQSVLEVGEKDGMMWKVYMFRADE